MDIKELETKVADLQKQVEASAPKLVALAEGAAVLDAKLTALSEQVVALTEQNATLNELVVAKPGVSGTVGKPTVETIPEAKPFKVGGKQIRFKYAAFHLKGQKVFAHEVAANATLREEVAKEFPGLVEPAE